jgi:hypothetical protein
MTADLRRVPDLSYDLSRLFIIANSIYKSNFIKKSVSIECFHTGPRNPNTIDMR